MRTVRLVLPVAAALFLVACSSSDPAADGGDATASPQAQNCDYDVTVAGVTAVRSGDTAPELTVAKGAKEPKKLVVKDLCTGSGDAATPADVVTVDYVGVGYKSREEFDSSFQRGQPAEFPLGGVIPGWTEGVSGMQPGGARLLLIPAAQAYGETGAPPAIAPDEPLAFIVELDSIGASGTQPGTP
jgi:peptidylprolyl isomerase